MSTTRTVNQFTLSNLPKEIRREEIYVSLPLSLFGLLARTSKQYETETAYLRLLPAAINAAPEFLAAKENATALASIALLKKHPQLLFIKKQVTDHYGREILASPYQIFLGAGDVWALKQVHQNILPLISSGETQALIQFKEQFPNFDKKLDDGMDEEARFYDDRNKQQIEAIMKQLVIVRNLIDVDSFNNNEPCVRTKHAFEALCKLFQPKPKEVIRSGLHFPLTIIKEVFKTYDALQRRWSYFFELGVLKPALDALSTVDGQCCQGGLNKLDMKKGPSRRCHSVYQYPLGKPLNLTFVNDKDKYGAAVLVDPYNGDVTFFSSTRIHFFKNNGNFARWPLWGRPDNVHYWKTYGEQKQKLMEAIMRPCFDALIHCSDEHGRLRQCVIV